MKPKYTFHPIGGIVKEIKVEVPFEKRWKRISVYILGPKGNSFNSATKKKERKTTLDMAMFELSIGCEIHRRRHFTCMTNYERDKENLKRGEGGTGIIANTKRNPIGKQKMQTDETTTSFFLYVVAQIVHT